MNTRKRGMNIPTPLDYIPILDMNTYKKSVKHEKLPYDEMVSLMRSAHGGCKESRDKLICYNVPLVIAVCKRYKNVLPDYDINDMMSYGIIGLIIAVDHFDVDRGTQFSTYAWRCIQTAIRRNCIYGCHTSRLIRLPKVTSNAYSHESKICRTYAKFGTVTDDLLVSEEYDNDVKAFQKGAKAWSLHYNIHRLSTEKTNVLLQKPETDLNSELESCQTTESIHNCHELFFVDSVMLRNALKELPKRHRDVLSMYYGIDNGKPVTLQDVGKKFGFTKERARQIVQRSLLSIRTILEEKIA